MLRQQSYRVASHLATQARAQMAMGGGRDGRNFVELVSTNARNLVIFPGASKDDAEYYSKQFGEYEKQEVVTSYTRKRFNLITGGFDRLGHPSESVRIQDKLTAVFTPSEIIYRPFGEIIYCIIKNNSIQTPKVGKVKWLDSDYDKKLKRMIDEQIVVHEIRSSHTLSESSPTDMETSGQTGGFSWEESELSDPSETVSFAVPASSSDSSDPAPSEMSAQEEASLYHFRLYMVANEWGYYQPFTLINTDGFMPDPLTRADIESMRPSFDPYISIDDIFIISELTPDYIEQLRTEHPELFDEHGQIVPSQDST